MTIRRSVSWALLALLLCAAALRAHDLFLKLDSYFLSPDSPAEARLLNGTFERSDAALARDRMTDVSVVGPTPEEVRHPPASRWRDSANTAILSFRTGPPGTYVLGVSSRPRTLELSGEDFDAYLRHDGLLDVLAARRSGGRLGTPARETYAKHVKAVVQVGTARSDGWTARLGHPLELVPLANPYRLAPGDSLPLRLLEQDEPVAGQLVYAAWEGWTPPEEPGPGEREPLRLRTDRTGTVRVPLREAGRWYVRVIHMERTEDDPDRDYRSRWTTLTFEIR